MVLSSAPAAGATWWPTVWPGRRDVMRERSLVPAPGPVYFQYVQILKMPGFFTDCSTVFRQRRASQHRNAPAWIGLPAFPSVRKGRPFPCNKLNDVIACFIDVLSLVVREESGLHGLGELVLVLPSPRR